MRRMSFALTTDAILNRTKTVGFRFVRSAWLNLANCRRLTRVVARRGDELDPEHLVRRLMNRVLVQDSGCWEWQGARNWAGYGGLTIAGGTCAAHVIAYILANGDKPSRGYDVMHTCDNPPCINPEHLVRGTRSDNMKDCSRKGRSKAYRGGLPGERNGQAKLTEAAVVAIRRRAATGEYHRVIAADYNVSDAAVDLVVSRKTWKHVADVVQP